jgi:hypothetical protein
METKYVGDDLGLHGIRQPGEPKQNNAGVNTTLAKYQIAKVLVGRYEEGASYVGSLQYVLVEDARRQLCDRHDLVTIQAKAFDDRPVDALIGE